MPKIKTLRRTSRNALEHSPSFNYACRRRNGLSNKQNLPLTFCNPKQRLSTLKMRRAGASEDIECSRKLFPHFIHVCNLTTDFTDRAAKVTKIPQHQFTLERMKLYFKVQRLDTINTQSMPCGQANMSSFPTICVCNEEQINIRNGVLYMGEKTFKKTKNMLNVSNLDTIAIRSAITDPEVREIHEALTTLLETPLWEILVEIKQNIKLSDASHKVDMLSMELDVLLNTVKHVTFRDMISNRVPERQAYSDIPEAVKDYLLRKREINGFGILNNNDFRVFVNHENKRRHLRENMLRIFPNIFKTKLNLQVKIGKPCICFYFQQGDKIYKRSSSEESSNENGYGTLGGFVSDQNNDTHFLTCSHGCQKGDIIFADDNNSGRKRIGECVFATDLKTKPKIDVFIDVALVKIDSEVVDSCNLSMLNNTFQQSNVKIYLENLQNIAKKAFVYKIGASTSVTKGLITSPEFHLNTTGGRAELFFVSDIADIPFAKRGDSGSIVFMIENSSALDTIHVIGMISGGFTPHQPPGEDEKVDTNRKSEKKDDEGAKKEVSCTGDITCFRMDKTMEFLRKKGIDVCFRNQI
nr:uncharacterized protein LOC105320676 isoform X1 [Crassostrea gigas]XP_034312431.1 uncharacterized protein LOC105320676 isoform X1 [Crassostrea gigas]XP_034312432.1 uncharacterized protein LOC105320676 isoform X1 [Crassostrea gigas]